MSRFFEAFIDELAKLAAEGSITSPELEEYLKTRKEKGIKPSKPAKGTPPSQRLPAFAPPELHPPGESAAPPPPPLPVTRKTTSKPPKIVL